jgi:hypothetical protein
MISENVCGIFQIFIEIFTIVNTGINAYHTPIQYKKQFEISFSLLMTILYHIAFFTKRNIWLGGKLGRVSD